MPEVIIKIGHHGTIVPNSIDFKSVLTRNNIAIQPWCDTEGNRDIYDLTYVKLPHSPEIFELLKDLFAESYSAILNILLRN